MRTSAFKITAIGLFITSFAFAQAYDFPKREKQFWKWAKVWDRSHSIDRIQLLNSTHWKCNLLVGRDDYKPASFELSFDIPANDLINTTLVDTDYVPAKKFYTSIRGNLISSSYQTVDHDDGKTLPLVEKRHALQVRKTGKKLEKLVLQLSVTDYTGQYPTYLSPDRFYELATGYGICEEITLPVTVKASSLGYHHRQ